MFTVLLFPVNSREHRKSETSTGASIQMRVLKKKKVKLISFHGHRLKFAEWALQEKSILEYVKTRIHSIPSKHRNSISLKAPVCNPSQYDSCIIKSPP